jgi:hypothetical protein
MLYQLARGHSIARFFCALMLAIAVGVVGCRRANSPATVPAPVASAPAGAMTRPATLAASAESGGSTTAPAEQTFENKNAGIRLHYPGDWTARASKDDVMLLVPRDGAAGRSITLDLPKIPFHLPGAMTLPLIQNGFVDDQRKHHPGLKVEESKDEAVAHSKAKFVRSTWKDNGHDFTDASLLIVHAERVYILSLDSDQQGYEAARAAMDKIAESIEWLK